MQIFAVVAKAATVYLLAITYDTMTRAGKPTIQSDGSLYSYREPYPLW